MSERGLVGRMVDRGGAEEAGSRRIEALCLRDGQPC